MGNVYLAWGASPASIDLNSATIVTENMERSLSKTPIIIPIPNKNNIGFDIGFTESDTITISGRTVMGPDRNGFATLIDVLKYQTGRTSANDPYTLTSPLMTGSVFVTGFNMNMEGGGDVSTFRLSLAVASTTV